MKPKKLWRIKLFGPEVTGTSEFTSEKKTYEFVRALFDEGDLVTKVEVYFWSDGRWGHFETLEIKDFPQKETPA